MSGIKFIRGSETSEAAAESMNESAGSIRERVFAIIDEAGRSGMTCDEVEVVTGMRHQTISARIRELFEAGRIVFRDQDGPEGKRPTRSRRLAMVYIVPQYRQSAPIQIAPSEQWVLL